MKIVIIGAGKIGYLLAGELSDQDYDVTIIENKPSAIRKANNDLDVLCIEGDGEDRDIQLEAGVQNTDLVIASTSADEVNMLCCLIAKKLGAKQTIARVRNPVYYKELNLIKDDLHLSMAVNPDFVMAEEILRILLFPAAAQVETFANGRLEIIEFKLEADNPIIGLSLAEIYKKYQIKLLICAVSRDKQVYIPDGDFVLHFNDKISVTASHKDIKKFFKVMKKYRNKVKRVMLCGGSRTAYYLSTRLTSIGINVKIIERDEKRCRHLSDLLPQTTIIHGDCSDHELMTEENLEHADAVIALTGIDEENIIMSLYAKSKGVSKVITKINSQSLLTITDALELDSVVSPNRITAETIVGYVRGIQNSLGSDSIETMYHIINDQIEALEFIIKEQSYYTNVPLKDLTLKDKSLIAGIVRGRRAIIPNGMDELLVGDRVIVICLDWHLQKLNQIILHKQGNAYE